MDSHGEQGRASKHAHAANGSLAESRSRQEWTALPLATSMKRGLPKRDWPNWANRLEAMVPKKRLPKSYPTCEFYPVRSLRKAFR